MSLYKRYIPGKLAEPAATLPPSPILHTTTTISIDADVSEKKRKRIDDQEGKESKRARKERHKLEKAARKARKLQQPQEISPYSESSSSEVKEDEQAVVEDHVYEQKIGQTKKRKHKLEHVLEDEDGMHLTKHSGLLQKFQQSTLHTQTHPSRLKNITDVPELKVVHDIVVPEVGEATEQTVLQQTDNGLPSWLANPTIVSDTASATFADMKLEETEVEQLSKLGFTYALPVQQALLPILLSPGSPGSVHRPGCEPVLPDIAVSAPTGSGKTIAYLMPIIESLRKGCLARHGLRALIVVPTRELVAQVAAVAQSLAKGSKVEVGMTSGSGSFKLEQDKLVLPCQEYDPQSHRRLTQQAERYLDLPEKGSEEWVSYYEDSVDKTFAEMEERVQAVAKCLPDHVPVYRSKIDLLVSTPGRLVEHIRSTPGFNLVHLRWLVIDEADRLLDNQNQDFLDVLLSATERSRAYAEQDLRERYLRKEQCWNDGRERRLRKIVLSATMTRDVSRLASLRLRFPKMIVVRSSDTDNATQKDIATAEAGLPSTIKQTGDVFELPRLLVEHSVPVGNGNEKPLVIIKLLSIAIGGDISESSVIDGIARDGGHHSVTGVLDERSDRGSTTTSESTDSSSSETEDHSSETTSRHTESDTAPDMANDRISRPPSPTAGALASTVLIFAASTESAQRLAHLLRAVKPEYGPRLVTLVKSKTSNSWSPYGQSDAAGPLIIIATDRAARGIDTFKSRPITHVIQYDVPRSITSYVHRVGRTARAGQSGVAWTLYTNTEAKWFVNEITKAPVLKRTQAVERVKVFMEDEVLRQRFKDVLASMREKVFGKESNQA